MSQWSLCASPLDQVVDANKDSRMLFANKNISGTLGRRRCDLGLEARTGAMVDNDRSIVPRS